MTRSKSTRYSSSVEENDAKDGIPLSEQIRLAQARGILPPGSLKHPSAVRKRTPKGPTLVDQIPSKNPEGIKVEEISFGPEATGQEEDEDEDEVEEHYDEEDDEEDILELPRNEPGVSYKTMKIPRSSTAAPYTLDPNRKPDLSDEIFITIMYLIPLTSLYFLFDLLSHMSYGKTPGAKFYISRLSTAIPTIGGLVFLSNRYPSHPLTAPFLMLASTLSGCRLFWLMNKANWLIVMKQAAPIVTLWIFSVVQLPIGKLTISLLLVTAWYWWSGFGFSMSLT